MNTTQADIDWIRDVFERISREMRELLDRGLTRVLERCLAKAPEERFASTRELGDALDRYLWRRAALERLGDALPWRRRAKTKPGPAIHPEDSQ